MVLLRKLCKLLFCLIVTTMVIFSYFQLDVVSAIVVTQKNNLSGLEIINYEDVVNDLKQNYNNDDVVGRIRIGGSTLNEPIVQGNDNSYYLSHNNYKNYNIGGAVFVDSRVNIDNSRKILIYGHNSPRGNLPFSVLEQFYDEKYYKDHSIIEITTSSGVRKFQIFGIFVETSNWSYMNINFENDDEFLEHINSLREKAWYDTDIAVSKSDKVLILQTCSYHNNYRKYNKKYLLVMAKEVKNSEF